MQITTVPAPKRKITAHADDGTCVEIVVPTNIPSNDRAEVLRALYREHVKPDQQGEWKGPCRALVPAMIADDVADAMDFFGSIVDARQGRAGAMVELFSRGYWAHGF